MSATQSSFIRYFIGARGFLDRARVALGEFDASEDVSALLAAALQLRLGIEARLNEYLTATLRSLGHENSKIKEYTATVLLKRLTGLNPRADHTMRLRITPEQGPPNTIQFDYTPVTEELARIHGRLGDMLHYTFFANREAWFVRTRTAQGRIVTLLDARDLVERGIVELAEATRGTLLAHRSFTELVEELEHEAEAVPPAAENADPGAAAT
jgi:hypothetical protein